jgi:hypothetical protein
MRGLRINKSSNSSLTTTGCWDSCPADPSPKRLPWNRRVLLNGCLKMSGPRSINRTQRLVAGGIAL